ncbi:MAG: hypothetical protein GY938_12825 [Ketobacter sp.]|nr:hypothetical protein [Ketobacter sp.]
MDYHLVVLAQDMDDFFISFWDAVGVWPMAGHVLFWYYLYFCLAPAGAQTGDDCIGRKE